MAARTREGTRVTPDQVPPAGDELDGEVQPLAAAGMAPGLPLAASGLPSAELFATLPPPNPAVRAETDRLTRLALAAAAAKDYPAAVPLLQRALALNPNSSAAHYNLGVMLRQAKRTAEAEVHYRQAIALSANCVPAYMNLAELLSERNQFSEALACYGKVIGVEPGNVAAYNNAGLILRRTGQFAAAAAALARAVALAPADPRARFNYAMVVDTAASRAEAVE